MIHAQALQALQTEPLVDFSRGRNARQQLSEAVADGIASLEQPARVGGLSATVEQLELVASLAVEFAASSSHNALEGEDFHLTTDLLPPPRWSIQTELLEPTEVSDEVDTTADQMDMAATEARSGTALWAEGAEGETAEAMQADHSYPTNTSMSPERWRRPSGEAVHTQKQWLRSLMPPEPGEVCRGRILIHDLTSS